MNDGNGGGEVSGIIYGLQSDGADQQATHLEVLSNTDGFGLGTYGPSAGNNSWTLNRGVIDIGIFESFGVLSQDPFVRTSSIGLEYYSTGGTMAGLTNVDFSLVVSSESGLTMAVSAVPLPSALGLLAGGLVILAWAGRRPRTSETVAA
jgi:hypothetical protein